MSLSAGTRLGPYEVVSLIGVGGMGEVYRARDARLNRDVAIKVLPELFASDADRLARFGREAQLLASLNHPNIAAIYGLEDSSVVGAGFSRPGHALVLELVPGPTLAERIGTAGPLPIEEALPIARQIAEALEAAHEHGIVHRDLKPANIKVSDEGQVKVLDFGLAKALEGDASSVDVSHSPTLTMGATRQGVILGTAAYMAPEQARGKAVDRRADIWAFGCVLYEMLTARRAFEGEVVSDTLAAILRGEPDWSLLPATTPPAVRRLLERCLTKDRRDRLQAIGDARIELRDAMTDGAVTSVAAATPFFAQRPVLALAAAALSALVAGAAVWILKPAEAPTTAQVTRSLLGVQPFDRRPAALPDESRPVLPRPDRTAIAFSPDGRTLVFRAEDNDGPRLFVRPLDQLTATPLAGTDGADGPFFSPDGQWIGFWAAGELRKIPVTGGVAASVTRVPGPGAAPRIFGASWQTEDVIVFATEAGVWRVAAAGGEATSVSVPGENEYRHTLPHVLPGGRHVLFTVTHTPFEWDDARIVVRSLETGEQKVLIDNGADARYVSTGHIAFMRRGVLMAAPFNLTSLEPTAGAVALLDDVTQAINMGGTGAESGAAQFAASERDLVYATGGIAPFARTALMWVDRSGTVEPLKLPDDSYATPRIAPNGGRVAVTIRGRTTDRGGRAWIHELSTGRLTALVPGRERAFWNIWSRDGERVVFAAGTLQMLWKAANGTGAAEALHTTRRYLAPSSWSIDGRTLAFVESHDATGNDIVMLDVTRAAPRTRPFLQTTAAEEFPEFSPDGRWIAYSSNHSGRPEVYVQPYPGPGPQVQVSIDGGNAPAWRADGAELVFLAIASPDSPGVVSVMAANTVRRGDIFATDAPRKLFEGRYSVTSPVRGFDVTPDGRRFLMVQQLDPAPEPPSELVLVENWIEELKRRVPGTNSGR